MHMLGSLRRKLGLPVSLGTATALGATLMVALPAGAQAADDRSPEGEVGVSEASVSRTLENLDKVDDSLLIAPTKSAEAGPGEVDLGTGSVHVPIAPEKGVTLTDESGQDVRISLPYAAQAGQAKALDRGGVTYPGDQSATSVIVGEVGVQMITTIRGVDAPTTYPYDLSLDSGQSIQLADGGAEVVNADGSVAFVVAPAWAKDANGRDVPTHFEVAGSVLTQVVDHPSAENLAYPVVADPLVLPFWAWKCLAGLGIRSSDIIKIATMGSLNSVAAAFGRAAVACITGK